ncbi:DUF732 domain-containing protein [Mycolicibacterium litorale]|uniref:DUF732 domain-containing protein n=1 Tax=Mycolicibacterium litorale TaxID=758802 RepID=A0AAD1MW21_9MYCO|nr:DUF732 domain-containing protein [Mycolicibacterium litorale]MCV7418254.1 DUF732 domain-containing protein [Mycolicibacterium litorale]TDY06354.1 uncharacterized protein DUF732 [Mycolicibacterium litorale]BBY19500.1 hypothetical protein MLIT_50920 [Mycolicibacterium litorale]
MNVTRISAAVAALSALALATAPVAAAGPEEDFLTIIRNEGIVWEAVDTPAVLDTGHAVCTDWSNGATFADEVGDLLSVTDWTDYQAGVFIGAATGAFCPQFEYKIG